MPHTEKRCARVPLSGRRRSEAEPEEESGEKPRAQRMW